MRLIDKAVKLQLIFLALSAVLAAWARKIARVTGIRFCSKTREAGMPCREVPPPVDRDREIPL